MSNYTKLSALINERFTVEKVWGFKYKKWNADFGKMEVSETHRPGFRKLYEVDTDKGKLDLGSGQIGSLLEAVFQDGRADLNDRTFEVKSNGKTGLDIRYYFNPTNAPSEDPNVAQAASQSPQEPLPPYSGEDIVDEINF